MERRISEWLTQAGRIDSWASIKNPLAVHFGALAGYVSWLLLGESVLRPVGWKADLARGDSIDRANAGVCEVPGF